MEMNCLERDGSIHWVWDLEFSEKENLHSVCGIGKVFEGIKWESVAHGGEISNSIFVKSFDEMCFSWRKEKKKNKDQICHC